jgi:hypothetical protein
MGEVVARCPNNKEMLIDIDAIAITKGIAMWLFIYVSKNYI